MLPSGQIRNGQAYRREGSMFLLHGKSRLRDSLFIEEYSMCLPSEISIPSRAAVLLFVPEVFRAACKCLKQSLYFKETIFYCEIFKKQILFSEYFLQVSLDQKMSSFYSRDTEEYPGTGEASDTRYLLDGSYLKKFCSFNCVKSRERATSKTENDGDIISDPGTIQHVKTFAHIGRSYTFIHYIKNWIAAGLQTKMQVRESGFFEQFQFLRSLSKYIVNARIHCKFFYLWHVGPYKGEQAQQALTLDDKCIFSKEKTRGFSGWSFESIFRFSSIFHRSEGKMYLWQSRRTGIFPSCIRALLPAGQTVLPKEEGKWYRVYRLMRIILHVS